MFISSYRVDFGYLFHLLFCRVESSFVCMCLYQMTNWSQCLNCFQLAHMRLLDCLLFFWLSPCKGWGVCCIEKVGFLNSPPGASVLYTKHVCDTWHILLFLRGIKNSPKSTSATNIHLPPYWFSHLTRKRTFKLPLMLKLLLLIKFACLNRISMRDKYH